MATATKKKVEHLSDVEGTPPHLAELADQIRWSSTNGTTTKENEVKVFHVVPGEYALIKRAGGSYYNRRAIYCPGEVKLKTLDGLGRNDRDGHEVWSTSRDKDGPLTYKKSVELIKEIDDDLKRYSAKGVRQWCIANHGKKLKVIQCRAGDMIEAGDGSRRFLCYCNGHGNNWIRSEGAGRRYSDKDWFAVDPDEAAASKQRAEDEKHKAYQKMVDDSIEAIVKSECFEDAVYALESFRDHTAHKARYHKPD